MKKKLLQEQREKAIIESFAKTFNSIKRIDEEQIDEINIGKGLATLGLAAALTGSPEKSTAQSIVPTRDVTTTMTDTSNLSMVSDAKAAVTLIRSYRENPFTADMWSKESKINKRLFDRIKKLSDYHRETGRIEQEDLEKLGSDYKQTPIATSFLGRQDTSKTYKMEDDQI